MSDFTDTIAEIIQGEAEVLGVVGMFTVASCIRSQLDAGWTEARVAQAWTARRTPGRAAIYLADEVIFGALPSSGYLCCLSLADTQRLECGPGELVIALSGTLYELHLFKVWPLGEKTC